jgi:spermidine/putrescine transport system ATP-binding protein
MTILSPAVELIELWKRFEDSVAVRGISMNIGQAEFFSMLGQSGCGKTTTLRMIAGFEQPSEGSIRLLGVDILDQPPHRRNVNMVFQNYALFPHLTVFDNVAFGLQVKRVPGDEIRQRVVHALEMVRLPGMEKRKPSQLSGGQQQRVALARALINRPAVLLLDEPLGALDQKLRKEMQFELKRLQREVGITFIYVTHDQEEALTMSDRIAVMHQGQVLQVDDPRTIYHHPKTRYVADFIGSTNFLEGRIASAGGKQAAIDVDGLGSIYALPVDGIAAGQPVTLAVRPEHMTLAAKKAKQADANQVEGTLEDMVFVGNDSQYFVVLKNGMRVVVREQNRAASSQDNTPAIGDSLTVSWPLDSTNILLE